VSYLVSRRFDGFFVKINRNNAKFGRILESKVFTKSREN
jgi:hypothetical protein